ncbi:MAG: carboxylating nicotinate-nucleotide diphosphorylase [Actinobacteria bacterium]|nr:carboxylating nicotinate-nucleotide diphosphorylase [Actinomycetota bacterium]
MSTAAHFEPPRLAVVEAVSRALAEDLLPLGDLTGALIGEGPTGSGVIAARASGVLAGRACATEVFSQVSPAIRVDWQLADGAVLAPGATVARIDGPLASILAAERTALNFLCHLSGVATLARRYVEVVRDANPATRVLDTRKTTPGLRSLEKAAARAGGACNHRGSLSEAVLVKDNHLAGMSIAQAVERARSLWPGRMIEVECDHPGQLLEALDAHASVVMLDNMDPSQVRACVEMVRSHPYGAPQAGEARVLVEVSGGVDLESAPVLAGAGVDLISVGAITHSAPALDLGLDLKQ